MGKPEKKKKNETDRPKKQVIMKDLSVSRSLNWMGKKGFEDAECDGVRAAGGSSEIPSRQNRTYSKN